MPAASAQVRDRLASGMREVDGLPVLIVSGIAALVMTGGALVLRRHHEDETDEHDLSVTAVLLDTIADATAAGVTAKGRDNPGDRRLVLARPCGSAHYRFHRRFPRHCADPKGSHPARTCGQGACKLGDLQGRFVSGAMTGRVCAGYGAAVRVGSRGFAAVGLAAGFQVTAGSLFGARGVISPRSSMGSWQGSR